MQVATLRILEKRFTSDDAKVLAEAMEHEVISAEIVTKDSLRYQLGELENRMFNKMIGLGLAAMGANITAVFFIVLNLKS